MKRKKLQAEESYAPVELWQEAPEQYNHLGINNGEYAIIIDSHTGRGIYVVAKVKGVVRYCAYTDGNRVVNGFQKVSLNRH